jgi:hypothetical protein
MATDHARSATRRSSGAMAPRALRPPWPEGSIRTDAYGVTAQPRSGGNGRWTEGRFNDLGMYRLRGTILYPEAA